MNLQYQKYMYFLSRKMAPVTWSIWHYKIVNTDASVVAEQDGYIYFNYFI